MKAILAATGSYAPEKIMTNFDLAKIVDTSDEWVTTRTGIKERRIAAPEEATSDLATKAAARCLAKAGMAASEVDLIIVATYTPDRLMPSTASYVQRNLGAVNAAAFDISAACAGFVYGVTVAEKFIVTKTYKNVLVVGAETCSRFLDWQDRTTCVLFGDGAGAVLLTASEDGGDGRGILSTYIRTDGSGADSLGIGAGGSRNQLTAEVLEKREQFIFMNGQDVFKFSLRVIEDSLTNGIRASGLALDDIDVIIPHQANVRIIDSSFKRLGLSTDKAFINLQKYGNTSGGSIPLALDEAFSEGRVKAGDRVALVGFGAGFTWGCVVLKV